MGETAPRFGMHFFAARVGWSYAYEPLWQAVRAFDPRDAVVSFDESEVVAYEVDAAPSRCVALRLTDIAATRVRAATAQLRERPVLVTLDGAPLYAAL